jgi:hypothetical protein
MLFVHRERELLRSLDQRRGLDDGERRGPAAGPGRARPRPHPPAPWQRTPDRPSRRRRDPISRDAIVTAAVQLLDRDGLAVLRMRRLADEFGTGATPHDVHPECRDHLYDGSVSSEPALYHDPPDVIQLDGERAVTLPLYEYRRLRALERRASPQDLDTAEADAVLEQHREWVAAGRPGAMPHEEFMAELLGSRQ